jgi:hypothetical protein
MFVLVPYQVGVALRAQLTAACRVLEAVLAGLAGQMTDTAELCVGPTVMASRAIQKISVTRGAGAGLAGRQCNFSKCRGHGEEENDPRRGP